MKNKIAKFVKESVEWLQQEQQGCCRYKLDDHLAIFVGWSAGYGYDKRNDVIQAKDDPDYGINVGIKVWTSDDMWTDFDWIASHIMKMEMCWIWVWQSLIRMILLMVC